MVRHGGNNHCNSYQPCWEFFRATEERWKRQRREHADRFGRSGLSPSGGQTCRIDDGENASQTCSNNIIPLTSSPAQPPELPSAANSLEGPSTPPSGLGVFAARIEERLGKAVYHHWFRSVQFVGATKGKIILSAESRFVRSHIEQQFEAKILQCFYPEYSGAIRVEVIVRPTVL
jgi:hypothetical protein